MPKTLSNVRILLVVLIVGVTVAIPVGASAQQFVSPSQSLYGMTYGDWSAAWWQWVLNFTNDKQPILDTTGDKCGNDQGDDPVFFLVGGGTGSEELIRTCTVPAGKAFFFPLINGECSTAEPDTVYYGANERALRVCASKLLDGLDYSSVLVSVDGVKLKGRELKPFRAQSPVYSFTCTPNDNFLTPPTGATVNGASSGTSVSDGIWIMLDSLPVGKHTIHFEAAITSGPSPFKQNVTYKLTVVK